MRAKIKVLGLALLIFVMAGIASYFIGDDESQTQVLAAQSSSGQKSQIQAKSSATNDYDFWEIPPFPYPTATTCGSTCPVPDWGEIAFFNFGN